MNILFVLIRLEKKRKRKKRNRSRSHSTSRRTDRDKSKISRRSGRKKQSSKSKDPKETFNENGNDNSAIKLPSTTVEGPTLVTDCNEFTSDDSKKIVISSIEDIPVVDEHSGKGIIEENSNKTEEVNDKKMGQDDVDDDAKALAEIQKEGEAYSARKQKKKSNFSFEILSSKSARLRHLIQLNNSNKANNNGSIKDLSNPLDKKPQVNTDKEKDVSEATSAKICVLSPETIQNNNEDENDSTGSPVSLGQKQQKPERTSRFGPSIVGDSENACSLGSTTNPNLKYPKFLPKSNSSDNNGDGLLPTPNVEVKPNSTKFYSKDGLADVETDSLGRIRRSRCVVVEAIQGLYFVK